jgi:hypothetical protein
MAPNVATALLNICFTSLGGRVAEECEAFAHKESRDSSAKSTFGVPFERQPSVEHAKDDIRQGGLAEADKRDNVIRLAFGGDRNRFEQFLAEIRKVAPPGTTVVLRGSAVTGQRWKDGAGFDADGPGTSDLDLTFVGHKALEFFTITGFFVPGVHSRPLSDEDPDIAPALVPLRRRLIAIAGRPVNIQASRDIVLQFRGDLLDQPYLVLLEVPRED